jgi:hypothetical protein
MDDATGEFLRNKVDQLLEIMGDLQAQALPQRGSPADRLVKLASELLSKANELDGRGLSPRGRPGSNH